MNDTDRQALIESRINTEIAGAVQMTELGVAFRGMAEVMEFAKMMAVSGPAVPPVFRQNPGACLAVALKAQHLGFEPFSFASKCYFVNDQLAYESQLINAIIIRRGPFVRRPTLAYEGDGASLKCSVTLHFHEPDGDMVYTSPTFAQITTKNSPLWKSDPQQQLGYYAVRAAARRFCPDVILGMYDTEEMAAIAARDVTPQIARPRADIGAKLAAGAKPQATYVATASMPVAREDAPVAVSSPEAAEASPDATGGPDGAADDDQTDSDPEGTAYEREVIDDLRQALDAADGPLMLKVVVDEFDGAITVAREPVRLLMRAMIAKRGEDMAGGATE